MPVGQRIWLVIAVTASLAGCRADGTGSLSLLPRRNSSPISFDVDAFVADHNRNAEAIESLEAKPTIRVAAGRISYRFSVDGHMAMERPRNFKLELETHGEPKADIGSNAEEFWYWIANPDKDQKWIYWCNYRDVESSDLPATYQPDWIIEALGLKPITPEEAAAVQVRRGPDPGTTLLAFPAGGKGGERYAREMIVSNSDHRIKKLRIFTGSPRVLVAEAQSSEYQAHPTGASGASSSTETETESCYLPQKLKLDWKREQLVLDVALSAVKVNQFDHAMGAAIFVEPELPGYKRLNLAELSRGDRPERRSRTRRTMPPPDPRDDVDLGRPAPIPDDEPPAVPNLGRRPSRPAPTESDDSPLPTLDELVGAPVPRSPSSDPLRAASLPGSPTRDSTIEQ